jgi:transposase
VARFIEAGHSCHAAARRFEVSVALMVRLIAAYRATGSLTPKPEGGWRLAAGGWRNAKLDPHRDFLIRRLTKKGDLTMPQLAAELAALGTKVTPASILRWFIRRGYSFKNAAGQRTRALRRAPSPRSLAHEGQSRMRQEPHRLFFLDETGTSTKMTRLRGRCPKEQRL